jgi:hypothetical protein
MLLAFAALRVTRDVGMIHGVGDLDDKSVNSFLRSNSPAVLFFGGNRTFFSYASLAIYRYRKQFRFSLSTESAAAALNITALPSAAFFNGSSRVFSAYAGNSSIEFAEQCYRHLLYALPRPRVVQPEELRRLLATDEAFVFGVDLADPFAAFRHDVPFFSVKPDVFKGVGFNLTSGYYAYRGVDRNLALIPDTKLKNYREYLKTPLIKVDAADFTERPFLGGFVMDVENETNSEEQMRIMRQMSPKFPMVWFAPIVGERGADLAEKGNFSQAGQPLFIVWKGSLDAQPSLFSAANGLSEAAVSEWLALIVKQDVQEQREPVGAAEAPASDAPSEADAGRASEL